MSNGLKVSVSFKLCPGCCGASSPLFRLGKLGIVNVAYPTMSGSSGRAGDAREMPVLNLFFVKSWIKS